MYKYALLLFCVSVAHNLHCVIVALAAMKNKNSNHKVIVLYDRHDEQLDTTVKEQQSELERLICALSKRKDTSSFYIEYPYLTKNFTNTYDYTTIHVPIKNALAKKMRNGSIEYKPFDKRKEIYFWIREMLLNFNQLQAVLKRGHKMPKEYDAVTIEAYLQTLQEDEKEAQAMADQLSPELQKLLAERMKLYVESQEFIKNELKKTSLKPQAHFLTLFEKIWKSNALTLAFNKLFTSVGTINSDISLLSEIVHDKNSLSVVLAGLYHAYHLEKALQLGGFADAFPEIDFKHGINAEDINNMTIPTQIPLLFTGKLKEFLALCDTCGAEAATKCSICKKTYYCGKECQKKSWKTHKQFCEKAPAVKKEVPLPAYKNVAEQIKEATS